MLNCPTALSEVAVGTAHKFKYQLGISLQLNLVEKDQQRCLVGLVGFGEGKRKSSCLLCASTMSVATAQDPSLKVLVIVLPHSPRSRLGLVPAVTWSTVCFFRKM